MSIDFAVPFKPFVLTTPMRIGQEALAFEVHSFDDNTVRVGDPVEPGSREDLIVYQSDSDWVDWGDDFEMPEPLFRMLFGVDPQVGMIIVMPRADLMR